jgi:hypothetical protein
MAIIRSYNQEVSCQSNGERQRPRPVSSILGWVNETSGDDELLHGKAKAQMAKKK